MVFRSVTPISAIVPGESLLHGFVWIREINGCRRTKDSCSSSSGIFQWWLAATVFGPCERMVLVLWLARRYACVDTDVCFKNVLVVWNQNCWDRTHHRFVSPKLISHYPKYSGYWPVSQIFQRNGCQELFCFLLNPMPLWWLTKQTFFCPVLKWQAAQKHAASLRASQCLKYSVSFRPD